MKGKSTLSQIRIKTRNCGGIEGRTKSIISKRKSIFNSIGHGTDITILTETKFKQSELAKYKQEWGSGMLFSCTPDIRAQAGVAIFFRKGLAITFHGEGKDHNRRVVCTLVEINTNIATGETSPAITPYHTYHFPISTSLTFITSKLPSQDDFHHLITFATR